jgi:hypothetical protein
MHAEVASEIWDEFKRYISSVDREEAADILVNILINHDEDIEDLKAAFKGDLDMKRVLAAYTNQDREEVDEDDEDYDKSDY